MKTPASYSANYRRSEGTHRFTTVDGVPVTAVTAADWDGFVGQLEDLPRTNGYIVTPELMTATGELSEIRSQQSQIRRRLETVWDISRRHPDALVLLGSPTFDEGDLVRNSLIAIRNGRNRGFIDKQGQLWPEEEAVFSTEQRRQAKLLHRRHGALVCSDLIDASIGTLSDSAGLPLKTRTLLVSSQWAAPRSEKLGIQPTTSYEERFGGALTTTMDSLFARHPHLEEVIMVDRSEEGSGDIPFTAQFARNKETALEAS
jgi:hypothetical protein